MDPIDALAKLAPHPGQLNRDEILFAAGRASAPSTRPWRILTAALAISQMFTLILLAMPQSPPVMVLTPATPPIPTVEPPSEPPSGWIDPQSYAAIRLRNFELEVQSNSAAAKSPERTWRATDRLNLDEIQ